MSGSRRRPESTQWSAMSRWRKRRSSGRGRHGVGGASGDRTGATACREQPECWGPPSCRSISPSNPYCTWGTPRWARARRRWFRRRQWVLPVRSSGASSGRSSSPTGRFSTRMRRRAWRSRPSTSCPTSRSVSINEMTHLINEPICKILNSFIANIQLSYQQKPNFYFSFLFTIDTIHPVKALIFIFYVSVNEAFFNALIEETTSLVKWSFNERTYRPGVTRDTELHHFSIFYTLFNSDPFGESFHSCKRCLLNYSGNKSGNKFPVLTIFENENPKNDTSNSLFLLNSHLKTNREIYLIFKGIQFW